MLNLPSSVYGHILDQLNIVTGSRGIINNADIPVVMRYACNLACTCKEITEKVNSADAVQLFLNSLANKYDLPCEHFAAMLNTIGARMWMWKYIEINGDDKVYRTVQNIYAVATEVIAEFKNAGIEIKFDKERSDRPELISSKHQTKQGFILNIRAGPIIFTRLGQIRLIDRVSDADSYSLLSLTERMIRKLDAGFSEYVKERFKDSDCLEIVSPDSDVIRKISNTDIKKISIEETTNKIGTKNLIVRYLAIDGFTSYHISDVKGEKVPDPVKYVPPQSERTLETIALIWEMLEKNSSGLDPIAKSKTKDIKKDEAPKKPLFNHISEVSKWGVELITKLEKGYLEQDGIRIWKTLKLESDSAHILMALHATSSTFFEKPSRQKICTTQNGHFRVTEKTEIVDGVQLHSLEKAFTPFDLDSLKKSYDSAIRYMGQGWVKEELKNYPKLINTYSEEDFVLLIKKENILDYEPILIFHLAKQFCLSIFCGREWTSYMYLWIRKNNLEKALETFNINLS